MHWEFWTKKLDEEDLIENGEFVSLRVFSFSFHCQCTLLSRCHKQEVCFNRTES